MPDSESLGIRTLRITDRMVHTSYHNRTHHRDLTLENRSPERRHLVFVRLTGFLRNLQVLDDDGRRLPIVPNWMLRKMEAATAGTPLGAELQRLQKSSTFLLGIVLPPDRPMEPGGVRLIALCYDDEDEVVFGLEPEAGSATGPGRKPFDATDALRSMPRRTRLKFRVLFLFFSIPRFRAAVARGADDGHEEFVVVDPLDDHEVRGAAHSTRPVQNAFCDDIESRGKSVAQFRVPPARGDPYRWALVYWMVPQRKFTFAALAVYWTVAFLVLSLAPFLLLWGALWSHSLASQAVTLLKAAAAGIVINSLALMYAIDQPWMDRYAKRLVALVTIGLLELLALTVRFT